MQQLDSKLSYVVMHRFLEKLWEDGNDDLGGLLGSLCLSIDGERSMDPAMVFAWVKVTQNKSCFTEREAFAAARAFLEAYNEIGPLAEIKAVLDLMEGPAPQEPDGSNSLKLWHTCWNEVTKNARSGAPYKAACSYARNAHGQPGRFQRNADGFLEFVPD